nr:polyprotein [Scallion mosaic virus]
MATTTLHAPVTQVSTDHKQLAIIKFGDNKPVLVTRINTGQIRVSGASKVDQAIVGHYRHHKMESVVKQNSLGVEQLIGLVCDIMKTKNDGELHLIDKKVQKLDFVKKHGMTYARAQVKHLQGSRQRRDFESNPALDTWLDIIMRKTAGNKQHKTSKIEAGWSGYLLNASKLVGKQSTHRGNTFIVRGKCLDTLFDARVRMTYDAMLSIRQFSDPGVRFWRGFNDTFLSRRASDRDHTCATSLDVLECGEVAALLCLAMFPCGKITCHQCVQDNLNHEGQASDKKLREKIVKLKTIIQTNHPTFKHAIQMLDRYEQSLQINPNYEGFAEIQGISEGRNNSVFPHVNKLNAIIVKGSQASSHEFSEATKNLLEIARFLRNRTENIEKGSLKHFRNKISQKSHVNTALLCDNQLDKNGNFIWGERGYHAKRFFSNYFETINPADGYGKYMQRPNPNGGRTLAINRLIVPTNFETLRDQMQGEAIELQPLTKACVSLMNGDYVHACCCVTNDAGDPILSDVQMPTKHHLVIGNSGDSKYIDMPNSEGQKMYIAKNGYCYMNIFLAMLVNVNETEAKAFTKMVRDIIVERLGQWPSLLDVATACYLLKVFFPDINNAELPRMLVDHTTKTIHVLDSYGSLSTGYHILKANTVEQLIKFTRHSLDSEIKHYSVGGDPLEATHAEEEVTDPQFHLKLLIKGIYNPRALEKALLWNRYLPLYAMLSPGILVAFYNSGSLEYLMDQFLRKDNDFVVTLVVLNSLARKVSCARSVASQISIIEKGAPGMIEAMQGIKQRHALPYDTAMKMLVTLASRSESNTELDAAGYSLLRMISVEVMEKNYLQILHDGWCELTPCGKLSAMWRSSKFSMRTRKELVVEDTTDLGGRYSESITSYLASARKGVKQATLRTRTKLLGAMNSVRTQIVRATCSTINYFVPDIVKFINVLVVIGLILTIARETQSMIANFAQMSKSKQKLQDEHEMWQLNFHFNLLEKQDGKAPTFEEFDKHLKSVAPHLRHLIQEEDSVEHQSKRHEQQELERIIAFVALVLMMFDAERSDCVTKILNKVRNLVTTTEPAVYHQALNEIEDDLSEKNFTIDFELDQDDQPTQSQMQETTFAMWWAHQLVRGHTIPHYRTEGQFMVFTRDTALQVALDIANGSHKDILLMGGVGSGKSTGLPFNLSTKGSVLLVEPTRPLAENVHRHLAKEPFYMSTTLRMRGLTTFGSAPVTIMTSGFALNYFAHNRERLREYDYTLFDEFHVDDSNAMAFRCLLIDNAYHGKVVKMSATPPGREPEYTPQHPVKVEVEESLSLQEFVRAQGTGANADVVRHGDNILVYVASYNEVDMLSGLLSERGYKVTKVDGRTMKVGRVEITTCGTPNKKHFIVATNIIENGVTLDIEVVVDFGTKVVPSLDSDNRMMVYKKIPINYGERIQRLGRVGRHKPGFALRIGHTEKGLSEIPSSIATEAAFKCFTYGLSVIPNNVTTSILANVTVRQARTMSLFELSPFYMANLVRYDGSMHQSLHSLLKRFKLRDSEIVLNKLAIPNKGLQTWLTASEYSRLGSNVPDRRDMRIPFMCKEVPEKLHEEVWAAIQQYKCDAGFGKLSSSSACKIAYTLQTDVTSIQRTVRIIDTLIAEERRKQEYFRTITANTVSSSNFSLQSIANAIRSRFAKDNTMENIGVLENAKAQLCEFRNLCIDPSYMDLNNTVGTNFVREFGALETVHHQTLSGVSKALNLKGRWDKSLITRDIFVLLGVICGGCWMLYNHFKTSFEEIVSHEAKGKRQRQKLKFRQARDNKTGREVYGDDGELEHYFGAAYTKKGKTSGRTRGMGAKQRRFVNMYNFDPEDFSAVRYVDPLTGVTLDENPLIDMHLVQEYFTNIRNEYLGQDALDPQQIRRSPGLEAYFTNNRTGKALKVDLTPHNPLLVCTKKVTIAGFPEREFELRQTGEPIPIALSEVPKATESEFAVGHESTSLYKGLRDYNPIASNICHLTNNSDGHSDSLFGIGYGPLVITNRHLFERNNGELLIKTRHGEFTIKNTAQLSLLPIPDRDILLIRLPKDIPPFTQRLVFRVPKQNERICLVGSNFQAKSISSLVSETSTIVKINDSNFWKHWISTKDGQCGSPIVGTQDGAIVGLHSLSNFSNSVNYFASFPEDFQTNYLDTLENHEWVKHWKYNTAHISWGALNIRASQPQHPFKTSKLIMDLDETAVYSQMERGRWLYDQLHGNLKAVAACSNQLVTKHTVRGKCQMFDLYLRLHDDARTFFDPLLGKYQKSRLNREAYAKDILKYATPIEAGNVDISLFECATNKLKSDLHALGFEKCNYITDEGDIFKALNMKSAVGALYTGKKKDYFADYTDVMKAEILQASCERLYKGQMGVWNGSLKAELRPLEKTEANKTRTFTAAPLDTLLAGKVCVDDFNNQFYDFNLVAPWSVGMTKFYGGWNQLLAALPDEWVYCDADGSQFDSSLSPYLINAVLDVRLELMEEWDVGEQMLRNLYTEIVYTPISTPDGTIIKKFKGNNSGQPSTVVDNTLMVILAVNYSLLKSGIPEIIQREIIKFFVNGDDLLIGIRPDYEYALDSMQENFLNLGLKYTFDSRSRDKADLWFMSHRGIRIDNIWIPKLEEERIVSILEWDRSREPQHRLEAICAAMIESWGYKELTHEIRKFYAWILEQAPYNNLAAEGKAPYIAETALRRLYTNTEANQADVERYLEAILQEYDDEGVVEVYHQAGPEELDAGLEEERQRKARELRGKFINSGDETQETSQQVSKDKDINAGTQGTFSVPRLKSKVSKMLLPKYKGKPALNLEQLLLYSPNQVDISNTRATQTQFNTWYEGVKEEYDLDDTKMQTILNGLMVWCIENGTSPNINGMWVMMDKDEQVEFPIKPLIDHAKPTFRQIMAHFSNVAEAYIEMRNQTVPYMPRYGLQRNLTDMSLARYAFDFYEMTSKTPIRAREAHIQMKAAALRNSKNNLFGLDGNVGMMEENTERHTAEDVSRNMHSLLGVRGM